MTKREQQDNLYPYCHHNIVYEFPREKFSTGFRGDSWCTKCPWALFSSEARRLENFGLMRNSNPPSQQGLKPGTKTGDMFLIDTVHI